MTGGGGLRKAIICAVYLASQDVIDGEGVQVGAYYDGIMAKGFGNI